MIDENIYKIIGIISICIILYHICNVYYNNNIDITHINKKFINNKKLDNIHFININIKNNLLSLAENKVITYINKYLEKKNKYNYNLKKQNISNIKMSFNKKVNIYKLSFILDLKDIIVEILLYIDSKNTIFIRYINHIKKNKNDNDIIYFELDNNIDITEIIHDKQKLYYLSNKIKSMQNKGYEPIIEDTKLKKVIEKFMNNNLDSNDLDSNNLDSNNLDSNNLDSNNLDSNNLDSNNLNSNNLDYNNINSNNLDYNNINSNIVYNKNTSNNNSNLFYPNLNSKNIFLDGTPLCDGCNKDSNIVSINGYPFDTYSQYSKI